MEAFSGPIEEIQGTEEALTSRSSKKSLKSPKKLKESVTDTPAAPSPGKLPKDFVPKAVRPSNKKSPREQLENIHILETTIGPGQGSPNAFTGGELN